MPELHYGGAETQFRLLITGLADLGCQVTAVIEQSNEKVDRADDDAFVDRHRHRVRFLRLRRLRAQRGMGRRMWSVVLLAFQVLPFLHRGRPQVAIVYSALGMRMTPLLRLCGVKVVFSERNAGDYPRAALLRKTLYFRCAHAMVANSVPATHALASRGFDLSTIVNGVEMPEGPWPMSRGEGSHPPVILVPARIAPVKNQLLVIQALARLHTPVPTAIFAGAVEDHSYQAQLEREASHLGVHHQVSFLGAVSDMNDLYLAADIVVLPSFSEGTPNVVLEAMTRNRLCLVSDILNNRDVVLDADRRFSPTDPAALAGCLERALSLDPRAWDALVSSNHAYVSEHYNVSRMVQSYYSLATTLVDGNQGP